MDYLAWQVASVIYMPVINSTGLEGEYDFDLAFTMALPLGVPEGTLINGVPIDTSGPRFTRRFASWGSNWNGKDDR